LSNPIKALIWCYLLLLIFEGALRKWVLPGLSDPLLIVRDPIALLIYVFAFRKKPKAFLNPYVIIIAGIASMSFVFTMLGGHKNLVVAAFGARTLVLHFPMIFVVGYFLNKEDVVLIGKVLLLIAIPMTLLLLAQFSSPQASFVNKGPGGVFGTNITGALGKYRPPGTFSFVTGTVQFYTLTCGFLMSAFFERRYFPIWLTIAISMMILIAIPVSISRTLMLSAVIVVLFGVYGIQKAGGSMKLFGRLIFIPLVGLVFASQFDVFDEGVEAFSARWENSTGEEKGGFQQAIVARFFSDLTRPLKLAFDTKLFGEGIGIGTQAGAKIQTGEQGFLLAEGEWGRLIFEMGAILGLAAIGLRIYFVYKLGSMSHKALSRRNLLPWLLFSTTALLIFNGQWGQPTTLGFTVFGAGLTLAAMRIPNPTSGPKPNRISKPKVHGGLNPPDATEKMQGKRPKSPPPNIKQNKPRKG